MATSRSRRNRRRPTANPIPKRFRPKGLTPLSVARRIVQPRQGKRKRPSPLVFTSPRRAKKPRAALAIRRERTKDHVTTKTQRRRSKLLSTDCIPRPDASVAASKRWEYHYQDKSGAGGGQYQKFFKERPSQRFFRRFC